MKSLFPKELPGSDPLAYISQLETVPANAKLYNVYAVHEPKEEKETLIGTLELEESMVRSKWGDENFFVRHQTMDYDLKFHPEWMPYVHKFEGIDAEKAKAKAGMVLTGEEGGCPFLSGQWGQ